MQSIEYLSNSIEDLQKQNQLLQAQVDISNKNHLQITPKIKL